MKTLAGSIGVDADRWDVAHALHHYCADYHSGQGSRLYRLGGKLCLMWHFHDAPSCRGLDNDEDMVARMIYDYLAGRED